MKTEYLKIETAARFIDVSTWTIRKWINQRLITSYKFGGAVRIKESDLLAFPKVKISVNELQERLANGK